MRPSLIIVCWVLVIWHCSLLVVEGAISEDGICTMVGVIPFTNFGRNHPGGNNLGYSQLAAVRLAIRQFNLRDGEVVPQLRQLGSCNVVLSNSQNIDSKNGGHYAATTFINALRDGSNRTSPCAVAGPSTDIPVSEVGVISQSLGIPLVAHGSIDLRHVNPYYAPFTSRTSADSSSIGRAVTDYLIRVHERTSFIVILYPLTDRGIQLREVMAAELQLNDAVWASIGYNSNSSVLGDGLDSEASMNRAAEFIKESGYKTVIAILEDPREDVPLLGSAAGKQEINNGDYFWMIYSQRGITLEAVPPIVPDPQITALLTGAAAIQPVEHFAVNENDAFLASWKRQGPDLVAEVNRLYPIKDPRQPGYFQGEPDYFRTTEPVLGAGFLYDAVMSIGFGGCIGRNDTLNTTSAVDHLNGIRDSNFQGSSGQVRFRNTDGTPGSRESEGLTFAAFNLGSFESGDIYRLTHVREPASKRWSTRDTFYYADGTTEAPALLRDEPEQNYLSTTVRTFSLVLLGLGWAICVGTSVWLAVNRKHRVVTASQPMFLHQLSAGSAIFLSTIFPMSFDESYGWTEEMLSAGCTSLPWLILVGHVLQYMALFAKLWRVNKVLQFRRTQVKMQTVLWPTAILFAIAIAVLATWTAVAGLDWEREVIEADTGESIAFCTNGAHNGLLLGGCVPIMVFTTGLAMYMAWKTKDVDSAYAESSWIFTAILAQLQIVFISIPILVILVDVSTDARHIGFSLAIFCSSMSLLCIVMFPKYIAWWKAQHPSGENPKRGSSAGGGVHVTGVNATTPNGVTLPNQQPTVAETQTGDGGGNVVAPEEPASNKKRWLLKR